MAFAATFGALLVPYESLVRAAEQRWGVRPARIAPRQTGTPHVEMFLEDLAAGVEYRAIAVGTSRVANGVRPDALDPVAGRTYNLGVAGGSAIATLELLDSLRVRPRQLIVGISPMDLTESGVRRGRAAIAHRNTAAADERELAPTRWTRSAVHELLHASRPERRRNLGQWLTLRRGGGELLAFLNNEDATRPPDLRAMNGYAPVSRVVDGARMQDGQWTNIPGEYARGRGELSRRLIGAIRGFGARGTSVVLVRLPTSAAVRASEDRETPFDRDVRDVARACGVPYIDGASLVGPSFLTARANFADPEHLNETGAAAFSAALAKSLGRAH